jgi:hypothetical protein
MDKQKEKIQGCIHLAIAKIQNIPKDPLAIQLFNGTNEITIKAASIKEKVDWMNALIKCQQECMDGRYSKFKKKGSHNGSPNGKIELRESVTQ